MFSANQKQITEQDNFTNSPLGKAFEKKKKKKTIEDPEKNIARSNALVKKYDDTKNDSELV